MDIGNPYADMYYGYEYGQVKVPEPSQGGGGGGEGGVTAAEVQQMINNALSSINITPEDDDSVNLNVNGQVVGTIDDVYLEGIQIEDDGDGDATVNFMLNNGKSPVQIKRSELDTPNIDCSTF